MAAKELKEALSDYLKGTDFNEINNTISIQAAWEKIVGNPVRNNTEILSFKNGTIEIRVFSSTWRNELSFQKQSLLKKLIAEEPDLDIKKIILK